MRAILGVAAAVFAVGCMPPEPPKCACECHCSGNAPGVEPSPQEMARSFFHPAPLDADGRAEALKRQQEQAKEREAIAHLDREFEGVAAGGDAPALEQMLRKLLTDHPLENGSTLRAMECRQSACRIRLDSAPGAPPVLPFSRLQMPPGYRSQHVSQHRVDEADGTARSSIYVIWSEPTGAPYKPF